jgi:choline dehydrogenase-like flavoprotein
MAKNADEHDFVIVSGGTVGLIVAARFSDDPNVNVLVLEAGDNHISDPRVSIPARWPTLLGSECD